jgi:hypothetical protein
MQFPINPPDSAGNGRIFKKLGSQSVLFTWNGTRFEGSDTLLVMP